MQNNINSNKYILNIKFGELSEFGTPCQSLVTNSSAIPEESNHSGAIPAESPDSGRNLWGTVKYCRESM